MLSIDTLINVQVSLSQSAAQTQNLNTLLVLTPNTQIDLVSRLRTYTSSTAVANDFGTGGPEYQAASLAFGQSPSPKTLLIGRWAQAAAAGQLIGATLSAAQQAINNFNTIANGGFTITVDGGAAQHVSGINLTAATNLNAVAADITNALGNLATFIWDATYGRFEATSDTTGAASSISYLSAPAAGGGTVDLSGLLKMLVTSSGVINSPGQTAESALAAATLFENTFGGQWYALALANATDQDHLAVAGFIETTTRKHFYVATTADAGALVASSTTDLPFLLGAANLSKTAVQYSSTNSMAAVSMISRILTVNYTANNSAITLMYKQEPGVVSENLSQTQYQSLAQKNCNVFAEFDNGTSILLNGTTVSTNLFIDTVIAADVFASTLKTALFNALYTTPTKIPQTDRGMHQLATICEATCIQFVNNGALAAGTWNSAGFGSLNTGDFIEKGFYVYAPTLASQSQANRASRMAGPIQIAGKLAGAIHTASVVATINP